MKAFFATYVYFRLHRQLGYRPGSYKVGDPKSAFAYTIHTWIKLNKKCLYKRWVRIFRMLPVEGNNEGE
jgi:hypothetical protein